jgi:hypothetical protein
MNNPAADLIYVSLLDLLRSLKLTVLGTSSPLHTWDAASERFVERGRLMDQKGIIMIDGKGEIVSARWALLYFGLSSRLMTLYKCHPEIFDSGHFAASLGNTHWLPSGKVCCLSLNGARLSSLLS